MLVVGERLGNAGGLHGDEGVLIDQSGGGVAFLGVCHPGLVMFPGRWHQKQAVAVEPVINISYRVAVWFFRRRVAAFQEDVERGGEDAALPDQTLVGGQGQWMPGIRLVPQCDKPDGIEEHRGHHG